MHQLDRSTQTDPIENGIINIDSTFDGLFAIGPHAMAGTITGFLTILNQAKKGNNLWINGRKTGELGKEPM